MGRAVILQGVDGTVKLGVDGTVTVLGRGAFGTVSTLGRGAVIKAIIESSSQKHALVVAELRWNAAALLRAAEDAASEHVVRPQRWSVADYTTSRTVHASFERMDGDWGDAFATGRVSPPGFRDGLGL